MSSGQELSELSNQGWNTGKLILEKAREIGFTKPMLVYELWTGLSNCPGYDGKQGILTLSGSGEEIKVAEKLETDLKGLLQIVEDLLAEEAPAPAASPTLPTLPGP